MQETVLLCTVVSGGFRIRSPPLTEIGNAVKNAPKKSKFVLSPYIVCLFEIVSLYIVCTYVCLLCHCFLYFVYMYISYICPLIMWTKAKHTLTGSWVRLWPHAILKLSYKSRQHNDPTQQLVTLRYDYATILARICVQILQHRQIVFALQRFDDPLYDALIATVELRTRRFHVICKQTINYTIFYLSITFSFATISELNCITPDPCSPTLQFFDIIPTRQVVFKCWIVSDNEKFKYKRFE